MKTLEVNAIGNDRNLFLWNTIVVHDVVLHHFRYGDDSLDITVRVLPFLNPDLDVVLSRNVSLDQLINEIKRVRDRTEVLFHVSLFNSAVWIKDIYGTDTTYTMKDMEFVMFCCTGKIHEEAQYPQTAGIFQHRYYVQTKILRDSLF